MCVLWITRHAMISVAKQCNVLLTFLSFLVNLNGPLCYKEVGDVVCYFALVWLSSYPHQLSRFPIA